MADNRHASQKGGLIPNLPPRDEGTFRAAFTIYATAKRRRGAGESSITQYRFRLRAWVRWLATERGVAWQDAGPDDLDGFVARRCQPRMLHAGAPLAPRTRSEYAYLVRDWHRILYAKHVLPDDAMADYPPLSEPEPAGEPLELAEVARLFAYTDDHPDRRLPIMARLCYFQALRAGELALLRTSDVHLHASVPKLGVLGKGRLEQVWLPLHPNLVPLLGRYTYWLAGQVGTTPRGLPAGTPLFGRQCNPLEPVTRMRTIRLLARAMRETPVDGRPHDLRRAAAWQVGRAFQDNPGPLKCVLRHAGDGALKHYRRPTVADQLPYFSAIPPPHDDEGQGGG